MTPNSFPCDLQIAECDAKWNTLPPHPAPYQQIEWIKIANEAASPVSHSIAPMLIEGL